MASSGESLGALARSDGDIRLPKLSHLVAGRLRDQIVTGQIAPGSLLQPENKLLEQYKVSRPTLREALRILEAESLISIGRGVRSGATVLRPSVTKAAEYTALILVSEGVTMRDLHEARTFFEPAIVRSLKGAALADATARLRQCVGEIEAALADGRFLDVVAGTNRFHEALAKASGNKTLALLVGMLQSISDDAYSVIIAADPNTSAAALRKNMAKTASGYSTLCDLLEKDKPAEAASFWSRYMERSLEYLVRSRLGERRLVPAPAGGGTSVSRR